ncbi:hypothetical protein MIND_01110500 [Mycena indigotica]|uniref:polynucleotide adenylyltransferase n=1 Tax=Mycena indigotica TaxID=2126181 RepID=A0A8H6S9Y7_9AGAR|nr:uncharacterized protein MIND_01110500 [Mycena indigotica]KAF7295701.1 hypothetical protein MIND_01110500 [Mycena indigotica]
MAALKLGESSQVTYDESRRALCSSLHDGTDRPQAATLHNLYPYQRRVHPTSIPPQRQNACMAGDIPSRRRKQRSRHVSREPPKASFEDGTDFIPLDGDVDGEKHARRKGKQRSRSRSKSPPVKRMRGMDGQEDAKAGRRDDRIEGSSNEREWDRGKRSYPLVFDFEEGSASKRRRVEPSERFTPWIDQVDWKSCKSPAELFHREVESFVNWISPSPQEDEIRGLVVKIISRFVTQRFSDAEVLPFGSFATKLYLPTGDIDLVIRSQSMAYSPTQIVLSALATVIRRSGLTDGKVTVIAKAKVPIVKFVTTAEYGHFNVDISINQDSGLASGQIINNFLSDFSGTSSRNCLALRALVLLTKLFLTQRQMNEVYTGGLGSYAIVCLCISFLQMHPKIRFGQIDPDTNLGVLVIEFFELYGHRFHYDEVGISLRNGGQYFGKRQRGWGDWGGNRRGSSLSIEDPGDPFNDISSGSYNFHNVRQNLAGAHDILLTAVFSKAGILAARKKGTATLLRAEYESGDMSILSAMLGVDQKTINNRLLVKQVYESQALHKLLGVEPKLVDPRQSPLPTTPLHEISSETASCKKKKRKKPKSKSVVVVQEDSGSRSGTGSGPQSRAASVSVRDAWAEADREEEVAHVSDGSDEAGHQADGRYSVGSPSKKRRKLEDRIVVYTMDSEEDTDEEGLVSVKKPPSKSTRRGMGSRASSGSSSLGSAERRDYWLSKGIGPSEGSSD